MADAAMAVVKNVTKKVDVLKIDVSVCLSVMVFFLSLSLFVCVCVCVWYDIFIFDISDCMSV